MSCTLIRSGLFDGSCNKIKIKTFNLTYVETRCSKIYFKMNYQIRVFEVLRLVLFFGIALLIGTSGSEY